MGLVKSVKNCVRQKSQPRPSDYYMLLVLQTDLLSFHFLCGKILYSLTSALLVDTTVMISYIPLQTVINIPHM